VSRPFWVVLGPTASGKTEAAIELAMQFGLEIVNLDSRQLYIGMDIGTSKPTVAQRAQIPHHMIDMIPPDVRWDAMRYARGARAAIEQIVSRGRRPLVVGGSGFYFAALSGELNEDLPPRNDSLRAALRAEVEEIGSDGLWARLALHDPTTAARLHPQDTIRIIRALEVMALTGSPLSARGLTNPPVPWGTWRVVVLATPRNLLKTRIRRRVEDMIRGGWIAEVQSLLDAGYHRSSPGLSSLGYPEIVDHVLDGLPLGEATVRISQRTWQYARRQLTWCRRVPADQWVTADSPAHAAADIAAVLEREE